MPLDSTSDGQHQLAFDQQSELFAKREAIQSAYLKHVTAAMEQYEGRRNLRIAACILEPVLQVGLPLKQDELAQQTYQQQPQTT